MEIIMINSEEKKQEINDEVDTKPVLTVDTFENNEGKSETPIDEGK